MKLFRPARYRKMVVAWTPLESALRVSAELRMELAALWLLTIWAALIFADGLTGPHFSIQSLYLVPLCFTTWCLGRVAGLTAGLVALMATLYINGFGDGLSAQSTTVPTATATWNAGMRTFGVVFVILFVGAFRRTFDREQASARIDPLTGLGNRRSFKAECARLELVAARDDRIVLCGLIDVDDFKSVNDRYGHAAGDEVLRIVAEALGSALRPYDVIARLGGDEFAFCLAVRDEAAARRKAQRIHRVVSEALKALESTVTCTLGAATGTDISATLAEADRAMYKSRETGKNSWKFG